MIARPCTRHESPQTCALITKARASGVVSIYAKTADGLRKKPMPEVDEERDAIEHALPFVCGKRVAPGGVR